MSQKELHLSPYHNSRFVFLHPTFHCANPTNKHPAQKAISTLSKLTCRRPTPKNIASRKELNWSQCHNNFVSFSPQFTVQSTLCKPYKHPAQSHRHTFIFSVFSALLHRMGSVCDRFLIPPPLGQPYSVFGGYKCMLVIFVFP